MKLLLHICCAPCAIMCIETLRGEEIEPVGFWDNPNICLLYTSLLVPAPQDLRTGAPGQAGSATVNIERLD